MDEVRRSTVLGTVFSTWVVLGLFLDGWAHNAGKPETFWTPYHAVLYSGFAVAAVTFVRERHRQRRDGIRGAEDPLVRAGFVVFALAGVGDAVWHELFGIEEDLAALLSPTHLALMIGGLLLIGGPLRRTWDAGVQRLGRREAVPDVLAVTLAVAVVAFFLQFLSPFHGVQPERYGVTADATGQVLGVAAILVTNALLLAGVAFAWAKRPALPTGTATVVLGLTTALLSSLEGFATVELVVPAVVAGTVADLLVHRGRSTRAALVATPVVLWLGWFAVYELRWGLAWPAEHWTGTATLAALTGWGLDLLVRGGRVPEDASDIVPLTVEAEVPSVARGASASLAGGS